MNLKEIKEIISLMNENGLAEIEVEREGSKLKIRRSSPGPAGALSGMPDRGKPVDPGSEGQSGEAVPSQGSPTCAREGRLTKTITSPMVGTFYRASSPESPSFVEIGQDVDVGQVVCIIEAMKLMNEIKSEIKGKIIEVVGKNAEPVEFGQTLFVVEPGV